MVVRQTRALWIIVFLSTMVLDQVVKALTRLYIPLGGHGPDVIPSVIGLRHAENFGVAFGQLQGWGVYLAPVAIIIAGLALRHTWKHPEDSKWVHVSMALLASGALGNMIDRVVRGKVTDMFEFQFFVFPVFNIADACISVAALILIIAWGKIDKKAQPEPEPAAVELETPPAV